MSDIALLADFGLSSLEARIYLWLAKNQPQTILELASNLEVARTSIYDNIQKLLEKAGRKSDFTKSQKIKAMSLESLYLLLAKRRTELEIAEKSLTGSKNISLRPTPVSQPRCDITKGCGTAADALEFSKCQQRNSRLLRVWQS